MSNPYPGYDPKIHLNDSQRAQVNLIVLHHTVTPENYTWKQISDIGKTRTYAGYDHSYHYDPQTGEETFIAYHYLVYKDGTYRRCLPDFAVGWHCGNWEKNCRSIAVSSVGDFSNQDPTEAQLQTIANIIRPYDRAVNGALSILGHKEISATACPGRILNFRDQIVQLVNQEPAPPPTDDPCAEISQQFHETNDLLVKTQAQVEELQKENEALKQSNSGLETAKNDLVNRLSEVNAELGSVQTKFNNYVTKMDAELAAISQHETDLEIEVSQLTTKLKEQEAHAADQMSVAEEQIKEKDIKIANLTENEASLKAETTRLVSAILRLENETLQAVSDNTLFQEFWRRLVKKFLRRG